MGGNRIPAENPRNNNNSCEWSILMSLFLCIATKWLSIFQLGKKEMTLNTAWFVLQNLLWLTVITLTLGKNTAEHMFSDVPPSPHGGIPGSQDVLLTSRRASPIFTMQLHRLPGSSGPDHYQLLVRTAGCHAGEQELPSVPPPVPGRRLWLKLHVCWWQKRS